MYGRISKVHFIGIGGIGMSGIAEVLINQGYTVSGSDLKSSKITDRLQSLGARVYIDHDPRNIGDADVVVMSSAVGEDNCEVAASRERGIPVIPRAEMLAELMRFKYGIAVAGSHGKTTTTTLVSSVLGAGGFDPTIVVGGRIENLGASARVGKGDFIVVEADESDGSFLTLSPAIAVVTNIDREHLDYYGGMDDLKSTFTDFLNKVPFYGLGIVGVDSQHVCSILPGLSRRFLTYGLSEDAELRAHDVTSSGFKTSFRVSLRGGELGTAVLTLPGRHNAQNALAAIAVGMELGMSFDQIKAGLGDWQRIERRLQVKGERCGVKIIDDYGHHPEEIRVTLQAVKDAFKPKRIIVVFQPHRYTRTKYLFDDFVKVLSKTDILYILDIYPAGESPIDGLSAELMCDAVASSGHRRVYFEPEFSKVIESVSEVLEPEDVVLTLGAGNVWKVAEGLVTTAA